MAGLVESFIFRMVVENQQFNKGIAESAKVVQQAGQTVAKTQGLLQQTSQAFLSTATIRSSVNAMKDMVNASATLANVKATADAVFGQGADAIVEWSEDSVEALGLSQRAAIQSATTIAALGKAAGLTGDDLSGFSTQMVKYATDLSQLYNTSVEDAVAAIQSGFSGSSVEPLRRYNIILNDGILKQEYFARTGERVTGVLSTQQRMLAFVSAFQKQAADSVGQWEREYNGLLATQQRFAGNLENFKSTIGESLTGPAIAATEALSGLLGVLQPLDEATEGFGSKLIIAGLGVAALAPIIGALGPKVMAFTRSMKAGESGVGKLAAGFVVAAGAMALWDSATTSSAETAEAVNEAFNQIGTGGKSVAEALKEMNKAAEPGNFANFANIFTGNEQKLDDLNVSADELKKRFKELADQSPELAAQLYDVGFATINGREAWAQYGIVQQDMLVILNDAVRAQAEAKAATRDYTDVLKDAEAEVERNEEAWQDYAKSLDDVYKAADDATKKIGELLDQASEEFVSDFDPMIAALELQAAQVELNRLRTEPLDKEESALQRQLDVANAQKAVRESINELLLADVAAQEDSTGKALQGAALAEAQLDFLNRLKLMSPELAGDIDAMIAEIEQRTPEMKVAVAAESAEAILAEIQAKLDEAGPREVAVDLLVDAGMAEEDAKTILGQLPDEKIVTIIAAKSKEARDEGLGAEETMNLIVKAITDEARKDIDGLRKQKSGADWYIDVTTNAQTAEADADLDRWRREQESQPIKIPVWVQEVPGVVTTAGTPVPTATATPRVRSGQPITVNVNMPSASRPQEVVAAVETWARRNGTTSVLS